MNANEKQVGGRHYKMPGFEEHWDRAWRLRYDPFQYIITKWVERWRDKGGIQDLRKAEHAIQKYIELLIAGKDPYVDQSIPSKMEVKAEEPGSHYVNQDGPWRPLIRPDSPE